MDADSDALAVIVAEGELDALIVEKGRSAAATAKNRLKIIT